MIGSASARAQSLVSIETERIATPVEDESISRVLVIDQRPVAIGSELTWILDPSEQRWERHRWHPRGRVLGAAGDGARAFLLLGSDRAGGATRVERVSLGSDGPGSEPLPPLPVRLASGEGALLEQRLFLAGTSAEGLPQLLSLDTLADHPEWTAHETWPGPTGAVTSAVAQNSALLVTIGDTAGAGDRVLQWRDRSWTERNPAPGRVIRGSARAAGQGHALYLVSGDVAGESAPWLTSFHTITGAWAKHGRLDAPARSGASWRDGILWIRPGGGAGGSDLAFTMPVSRTLLLAPLDWAVIAVYLFITLAIGLHFRSRAHRSEAEFFLGGRSIPFWAAGMSLFVSNASSISYIAVPAKAFDTNWQYLLGNLFNGVALMSVAVWVVPLLRRLDLTSVFHYLETRFHPTIRLLSSALFVVFQLGGRMTIILFVPALAISTVTGVDVASSILVVGGVTVCYTVLGGMKAVIWTDFMQFIVMFGGAIFTIAYIMSGLNGGVAEFLSASMADGKTKLVDWSFDPTGATVWVLALVVLFDTVLTFPKDQVLMQRVLSTRSAKEAGRSVWVYAVIVLPASVLFYLIGTALYVFYQVHPERLDPSLTVDATFPLFMAAELPVGITGLLIAGLCAASMSTLSSILSSVATVSTVDFYEYAVGKRGTAAGLRFAEMATVLAGLIGIGLAVLLSRLEIRSLLDLALELWGLLGGGFAGAYTLGMFTRRSNWQGVLIGVAASIVITVMVWSADVLHPFFYLPIATLLCIVVGYAASWLFPAPASLAGLTVYGRDAVVPDQTLAG